MPPRRGCQRALTRFPPLMANPESDSAPELRTGLAGTRVLAMLNGIELFGQERANIEVLKSLRAQGAEVIVGVNTVVEGGDVAVHLRELGFQTFEVPFGCQWSKTFFIRKPRLIFTNLLSVLRSSWILGRKIHSFSPTHIHIGNPLVYSFVCLAMIIPRVPLVYRMGDEPPHDSRPNLIIWKGCYHRATTVVANSKFVRQRIFDHSFPDAKKVRLIYNTAPGGGDSGSREIDRNAGVFKLLYVGQISEHKGIVHALEAGLRLARRFDHVEMDIVGGSVYTSELEEDLRRRVKEHRLGKRIRFRGHVKNPTRYYEQADLLLVPSLFEEPAANVVLEAKRHGLPAVVYPSGGLPELVEDGGTGMVCALKDAAELEQHAERFIQDVSLQARMRSAALEEYARLFGLQRYAVQWAEVYRKARG